MTCRKKLCNPQISLSSVTWKYKYCFYINQILKKLSSKEDNVNKQDLTISFFLIGEEIFFFSLTCLYFKTFYF